MRLHLVVVLLLLALGVSARAEAQAVVAATRRQRIISSLHIHRLRAPAPAGPAMRIDPRALQRREPLLRQQLRLPITDRVDLTLTGRVGWLGPSTLARIRLRF